MTWSRRVRLVLVGFAVALLAGCGTVGAALEVSTSLGDAGFPGPGVSITSTNGVDTVEVTTGAHPTLRGDAAFDGVATVIWNELPRRFDRLEIAVGTETAGIDRAGLVERYGPRDPALEETTVGDDIIGTLAVVGLVLLAVAVLVVVLVVVLVRRSRGRRRMRL